MMPCLIMEVFNRDRNYIQMYCLVPLYFWVLKCRTRMISILQYRREMYQLYWWCSRGFPLEGLAICKECLLRRLLPSASSNSPLETLTLGCLESHRICSCCILVRGCTMTLGFSLCLWLTVWVKGHWEGSADLAGSRARGEDGPAQWTDCPGHSTGQGGLGPSLWDGWAGDTQDTSDTISEGEAGSLGGRAALPGAGEAEAAWTLTPTRRGQPLPCGLGQASSALHALVSTLKWASFLPSLTYQ